MRRGLFAFILCLCLASMPQTSAQSSSKGIFEDVGIGLRYWNPNLSGAVSSGAGPVSYARLGFEANSMISVFPFKSGEGNWRFGVDLFDFDSNAPFIGDANFKGMQLKEKFLHNELSLRSVNIAYLPGYTAAQADSFSLIWGAKLYRHKAEIAASAERKEQTYSGISPVAGFRLDKNRTGPTAWYIEGVGIPGKRYILDAEAGVVQSLQINTTVTVGYRTSMQRTGNHSDQLSYRLGGPFAQMKHLF